MERNIFEKQRELNDRLNRYRDEYYNRNAPSVSDEVYDRLFDELKELEQETGIQMANSPTQTVGYPAVSRLEKTRHEIPLLSLDKTKSSMDLLNFMGEQQVMLMLKLDGLTVKLTYENIGGFTADYLLMKNGEIDLTSCDSLENGVILLYNKVRSKVNSELDLLLDEGDVDAILMGKKTQYPDAAIRLTEQMAQEFINDLFSTLRERMLDLQYCKVVFVGGGAILLKRQIETSGKVGTPFFVPKINANADGYEYLYRIETAGR